MDKNIDTICNYLALSFTLLQTEQLFQIISLILTCISISISLIFRLCDSIKRWKNTKSITEEEVNELLKETQTTIIQLQEKVKEYEEKRREQ